MEPNNSRELLQKIHDEINNLKSVDENEAELLQDLDKDIRTLLARSGEKGVQVHPSVLSRLDDAICHFEVTYPKLTTLISKFLESLSNAGI